MTTMVMAMMTRMVLVTVIMQTMGETVTCSG